MKMKNKQEWRLVFYYVYLLLVWGGFRYFIDLPEVVEELWFKPLIWLMPWFWWRLSLKGKPDLFDKKDGFKSVVFGVVAGGVYLLILGMVKGFEWGLSADLIGIALATAMVEEITFSGMVLGFLDEIRGKSWINLGWVGVMVAGIHLPINVFVYGVKGVDLIGVMMMLVCMGIINGWIRQKTNNIWGSVIARWMLMLVALG